MLPHSNPQARKARRVVVLSRGGSFLAEVMNELRARRPLPELTLLLSRERTAKRRQPLPWPQRLRELLLALPRAARQHLLHRRTAREAGGGTRVVITGWLNGAWMRRDLRRLAPDVVVLAGCGLLAPEVLEIPREGVVNVHPGLLPWIRGNDLLANSLLRGVPLGATTFRVDAGIDTGGILERRLVPVRGGESRNDLRLRMDRLWVEMTAELVAAAAAGPLPPARPQRGRFPLCRVVADRAQHAAVDAAVHNGTARALFERWKSADGVTLLPEADAELVPHAGG
ncbi:MAG TPA: formyltransferase family protein [Longimicrobium sp.]